MYLYARHQQYPVVLNFAVMFGTKLFPYDVFSISAQYVHVMSSSYHFMYLRNIFMVLQKRSYSFCHCSHLVLQYYVSIQVEP